MLILGAKNTSVQTVLENGVIDLGSIYRKRCKKDDCGITTFSFDGNSISLNQQGMYKITVVANVSAPTTGNVTLQLSENDTLISGATATETISTADTEVRNLTIDYYALVNASLLLGNVTTLAKNIKVVNTGIGATINSIVVDIIKVV